ncbi:MAG TPA: hypothetical protein VN516_06875 [Candidatus Baltobacteraceae bacterium]|nr:hypothetical protein [Candidatus Baltobacteraceae bacterium]
MHATIQFIIFWALAFLTLGAAVVMLGVFSNLIESDVELNSLRKEIMVAAIASFIEAAGLGVVLFLVPAAYLPIGLRAMIIPAMIVALVYKIAHLESWSIFEVVLLLAFQVFAGCLAAALIFGHFLMALAILAGVGIALAVIASFAKSL